MGRFQSPRRPLCLYYLRFSDEREILPQRILRSALASPCPDTWKGLWTLRP